MDQSNFDLRAVIGYFFIIISIMLLVTSFVIENGSAINRDTGTVFLVFGVIMVALSKRKKKRAEKQKEKMTSH